jgi:hypothetical protein
VPNRKAPRFVAYDTRKRSYTGLGVAREPWLVVDTLTGKIIDELHSGRAARSTAAALNREAKASGEAS